VANHVNALLNRDKTGTIVIEMKRCSTISVSPRTFPKLKLDSWQIPLSTNVGRGSRNECRQPLCCGEDGKAQYVAWFKPDGVSE
jgi:hypothetical protein